jgi:GNAT superfamily N-acetyltransferase
LKRQRFTGITLRIARDSLRLYCLDLRDEVATITPTLKTEILVHDKPLLLDHIDSSIVEERIAQGDMIFIARHDAHAIACLFASKAQSWVNEIEDRFIVGSSEIYFYDAYTDHAYRGNRIYSSLISTAVHYFKNLSYSTALIFSTAANRISLKGIEHSGFTCYQTVQFYNFFGWKQWTYSTRNKNVASRFSYEA